MTSEEILGTGRVRRRPAAPGAAAQGESEPQLRSQSSDRGRSRGRGGAEGGAEGGAGGGAAAAQVYYLITV